MKRFLSTGLLALAMVSVAAAQSAEDILNAHIEAVGGADAWAKVENSHTKMSVSVELPQGVIVLDVEAYQVYPGHFLAMQNLVSAPEGIPDISSTVFVSPDEAWVDNFQGRQDISENMAAALGGNMPNLNHPVQEVELLEQLDTIEVSAQEEVNGKMAHVLTINGPVTTKRFYDVETGLLLATEATSPMGAVRMNVTEYQDYDGLKMAFIQEGQMGAMGKQTIAMTEFHTNIDLTAEKIAELAKGSD
ncbi:MAG: hypothetical protein JJ896_12210 [Rhodothermales bacterium]|nr:hypothetical protein [Rhodothermales bacterium]MBO6780408.1 hypothetical protein [Rhodothermales bacterium]